MKWELIETAPKDKGPILGYADGEITVIEWWECGGYWMLCVPGSFCDDAEWWPTHWKSLPKSPKC